MTKHVLVQKVKAAIEAKPLVEVGYCRVSNKHRLVARLDRPDWKAHMASKHSHDAGWGEKWVQGLGDKAAADFYRRVYSKDQKTVSHNALRLFPPSGDGHTKYVAKLRGEL